MQDDIGSLPLPAAAKRYARGRGMRFLRAKPQNYIDMIATVTGQQKRKRGFGNKDAGERSVKEAEDPRSILRDLPSAGFTVEAPREEWTVAIDGTVVAYATDPYAERLQQHGRHYRWHSIAKFDVVDYRRRTGHYPFGVIKLADIGYMDHNGRYFKAPVKEAAQLLAKAILRDESGTPARTPTWNQRFRRPPLW